MKVFVVIILCLIGAIAGLYGYFSLTYPTIPPITTAQYFIEHFQHPHAKLSKQTIAFLPYWRTEDLSSARLDLLSEINYFGLTIDGKGNFYTVNGNETDPGWREWQADEMKNLIAKTQIMGGKFSVTIINHTNDDIEAFLTNEKAQERFTNNILSQVTERNLNDITIDFEYYGEPERLYRDKFTQYIQKLNAALAEKAPETTLTIAIMPRAARDPDLYDFPALVPYVDRFIGMSYDYYGSSADIAAPGAPLKGYAEGVYFFDVKTTYDDYLKYIPKEKLIMGIPYYGWDRAVEDAREKHSHTFPSSSPKNYAGIISYGRLREENKFNESNCLWDELAAETWCWYTDEETDVDHQVWLADERSISARYDFADDYNLAGVAIWVLGYDKTYPELWNIMQDKLQK